MLSMFYHFDHITEYFLFPSFTLSTSLAHLPLLHSYSLIRSLISSIDNPTLSFREKSWQTGTWSFIVETVTLILQLSVIIDYYLFITI